MNRVFMYWIGKEYKLLNVLKERIYTYSKRGKGYEVVFLTKENLKEYVKVPAYFYRLQPAHQADYVRVNVLCDFGGIWLDSDTIVVDTLDSMFKMIEDGNGFFIQNSFGNIINSVFGTKPNTDLMLYWKEMVQTILDQKETHITWIEIGAKILTEFYETPSVYEGYTLLDGPSSVCPVPWDKCVQEFLEMPYENYKTIVRPNQPFLILFQNTYKVMETMSEEEVRNGNRPIHYFLQD